MTKLCYVIYEMPLGLLKFFCSDQDTWDWYATACRCVGIVFFWVKNNEFDFRKILFLRIIFAICKCLSNRRMIKTIFFAECVFKNSNK